MRTYAGIELGGTKVVCGLATADGRICERVEIETTSPDETLSTIRNELEGFEARNGQFSGLGVGTFGPVQLVPAAEDFARIGVTIICPDHGPFPQAPGHHLSNRGCPDCAKSGFNPNEPGLLYYIAVTTDGGDTRYKIGITNHTVEDRFVGADLARIRIVKTWQYAIGRSAAEREAEILSQYEGDKYYGPDILVRAGNTELFTHDILGLDKLYGENV